MNLVKIELACGCLFAASIALSTVHPWGNPRSGIQPGAELLQGGKVPETVLAALATKCGDCHSEKTHYPVYTYFAPVSWMVERDVHEGRKNLDMSQWQSYSNENRINALTKIASEVHTGQMPPRGYLMLHPGARPSAEEQQLIYDWAKSERKRLRQELNHRSDQSSAEVRRENP